VVDPATCRRKSSPPVTGTLMSPVPVSRWIKILRLPSPCIPDEWVSSSWIVAGSPRTSLRLAGSRR
jgi:hypothetical protein